MIESSMEPAKNASDRYCLRCQALRSDDGDSCRDCWLQFDPENPETYRTRREFRFWQFHLPAIVLSIVFGVLSYALTLEMGEMGWGLFFCVPVSVGAILGYYVRAGLIARVSCWLTVSAAIVTALIFLNLSGLFCGLIGGVVLFVPGMAGVAAGTLLRHRLKSSRWSQRCFLPALLIGIFPFAVAGLEKLFPRVIDLATVTSEAIIDAPVPVAWNSLLFYEEVDHEPPLILRLALPRPVRSEGRKSRVGEVVRCVYESGHREKRISQVEEDRLLAFDVIEQKLHFERDVTLVDGSFELDDVPGNPGTTRLVVRTRYQRHLYPRWLWQPVETVVVRSLLGHVLEGIKEKAEMSSLELVLTAGFDGPAKRIVFSGRGPAVGVDR